MKAQLKTGLCFAAMCFAIGLSAPSAHAFSLLGPFEPWMSTTNGFYPSDENDIGGPMCISNEYRWNVPVVTYGFDQSFLDRFGTNGVAAVESAIQILNDLPPASQIALANYPFDSQQINFVAQSQSLYDLKSQTLSLLLEHLGLAQPTRYIYVLRQWNPVLTNYSNAGMGNLLLDVFEGTNISNYVVTRNYDPQTLNASPYVNEIIYSAVIYNFTNQYLIEPFALDPADSFTAIGDFNLNQGGFYEGLTADDVGGLAYLLSTNNVNYETFISGVTGVGANANSFVNGAWRPGVDKITFIPQPVDSRSGAFLPTTNYFTDNYITNGVLQQQQLARVISQPDFLFSAGDVTSGIPTVPFYTRMGTSNWLNNSAANGNINGAGPGVIQPQVQIIFNKLGRMIESESYFSDETTVDQSSYWGSFDGSTNAPFIYPSPKIGTNQMTFRMWLSFGTQFQKSFDWKPSSLSGSQFVFQTSPDLNHWDTIFSITNNGSVSTYLNYNPSSTSRFYRLVPQ